MVPKGKRSLSKSEFLSHTYKMYSAVVKFLLVDFGIKSISRDLKTFCYNAKMTKEDSYVFKDLCEKYRIDVESDYPMYVLEHFRNSCFEQLNNILQNVIDANTIYPITIYEFNLRRGYQYKAISSAYMLHQLFIIINKIFHPNTEKYMVYVDIVDKEISLLKRWKKSDNKILKAIKEKEELAKAYNTPKIVTTKPIENTNVINNSIEDRYTSLSEDTKITYIIQPISFDYEIIKPISFSDNKKDYIIQPLSFY